MADCCFGGDFGGGWLGWGAQLTQLTRYVNVFARLHFVVSAAWNFSDFVLAEQMFMGCGLTSF